MKDKGTHEGCIEQMARLFSERLYSGGPVATDGAGLIRMDDYEMDPEVQKEVKTRLSRVTEENLSDLADLKAYRGDFLATNGFRE
jgi:enoyl-[acyl-carrier protein] reductase/trans-2-enoyl-CoA reductase (NAD+)